MPLFLISPLRCGEGCRWCNLDYLRRFAGYLPVLARSSLTFKNFMREGHLIRSPEEHAVVTAFLRGEFVIFYQPIVSVETGDSVGAEALIRWNHPEDGVLPPARFLSALCNCYLGREVGYWVLDKACRARASWRGDVPENFRIAVNLCNEVFTDPQLVDRVEQVFKDTGLTGDSLELEITEGIDLDLVPHAEDTIKRLREMGITIAYDDFGMGYASLKHLLKCPIDRIKIDKSFVAGIPKSQVYSTACSHLVQFSRSMEIEITAEGVETDVQLRYLKEFGCTDVQGYFFSKPAPESEFLKYLQTQHRSYAQSIVE